MLKSVWKRKRGKDVLAERGGELQKKVRKILERWVEKSEEVDHSFKPIFAHSALWYKHIYRDPAKESSREL